MQIISRQYPIPVRPNEHAPLPDFSSQPEPELQRTSSGDEPPVPKKLAEQGRQASTCDTPYKMNDGEPGTPIQAASAPHSTPRLCTDALLCFALRCPVGQP